MDDLPAADPGGPDGPPAGWALPAGLALVRTTPVFTAESVPDGLRRAHRVAAGVWGRLRVRSGHVTFVVEASGEARRLAAGEQQVIPPDVPHHVEPDGQAAFVVEFHR